MMTSRDDLLLLLSDIVGEQHVRRDAPDRIAYSSDLWPRSQIWKLGGQICRHPPDAVVWPANEDEVSAVVRLCRERGVPLIPYGAGSGVCGGTLPIFGGVVLDVRRMAKILDVDERDLTVRAQPGIVGMHLEEELSDRGYTLGHFPSSILCSTLGGWLAGRSAGQYSSRYGKIEDMVTSMRVVLPDGSRLSTGPEEPFDWTQIMVGSEGTLGIITEATLRVFPAPQATAFRGYRFRTMEDALRGIRQVMQAGLEPNVVRLYDPFDSLLQGSGGESHSGSSSLFNPVRALVSGSSPAGGKSGRHAAISMLLGRPKLLNRLIDALPVSCLMIIGFEGEREDVDEDIQRARRILEDAGGTDGGEGPGLHWLKKRYGISFKQSPVFEAGAFVDTMEVATTWSRLLGLYWEVRRALSRHVLVMAHFSHAYREGCSIYFTFAGYRPSPKELEALYAKTWADGQAAVLRVGATLSHHHGVGYAKRANMIHEHGAGLALLYGVKDTFDPADLMNPGKVLPDREARGR